MGPYLDPGPVIADLQGLDDEDDIEVMPLPDLLAQWGENRLKLNRPRWRGRDWAD
ncbi:hypothetical protein G3480_22435 [Thiorhodococcus mannitoliphagus]|uniref:Uncharacterized protein n=1 Tax=Thiorhodococcus mannitoliphagus TaxID=329406 RepID=A0A6P1E3F1_9GAMM|nr:hypothetical protein [Thiorhodococcus mannitoliphagus]NEX23022.1 hypothetical protein [Thiorhodococcus mannitoliphagus]